MTPEQKARLEIDKKLAASGWLVQEKNEFNPAIRLPDGTAPGVAVFTPKKQRAFIKKTFLLSFLMILLQLHSL